MNFDEAVDRQVHHSHKWREHPDDVIPLSVADMDFRSPDAVTAALRAYVDHGVFGYPHGLIASGRAAASDLAELLVERMARCYGWHIAVEDVVFLPGAVPGLNLAAHCAAAERHDRRRIVVQTPVYPKILAVPARAHQERVDSALVLEDDGSYAIDLQSLRDVIVGASLFILCNPQNPVGRVVRRRELEEIAEICLSHGVAICADEMHSDLLFDERQHVPIASLDPAVARQTITLLGPSKTFNLAGLQCAAAIIPNADLRRRFNATREGLVPWVNAAGLIGAEAAYRDGQRWLEAVLEYLQSNRDFVFDFVRVQMPGLRMARPESTYLAWIDCRERGLHDPFEFFLTRARVALADGRAFGAGGDGFVRLNFASPRAVLEEALHRMRSALTGA